MSNIKYKSSARSSLKDYTNISYNTALRRILILSLVVCNCNFWKVFKTYLDFKFVNYNNSETGAAVPYIAFAPLARRVLPSDLLFLNYTKNIQTSQTSLCSCIATVLRLLALVVYFKTQFLKKQLFALRRRKA